MINWFTADCHFGHEGIIRSCERPFCSVEQMNETLLKNWNAKVQKTDVVYVLGDFVWGKKYLPILDQLHGKFSLIIGNHDESLLAKYKKHPKIIEVEYFKILRLNKKKYTLCHYPMFTWPNRISNRSFHLFGHVHQAYKTANHHRSLNVGVDLWNFAPVSLEEIDLYFEAARLIQT